MRIYRSADCSPLALSPAGLLVPVGNCFFIDEGVYLGSWRPDCAGVDYASSNGLDKGNSYSNNANDGSDEIYSALVTASGVVTLTATTTASSSPSSTTSSSSGEPAAATGGNSTDPTSSVAGKGGATTTTTTTKGAGASQTADSGADSTRLAHCVSSTMMAMMGMGMLALAVLS